MKRQMMLAIVGLQALLLSAAEPVTVSTAADLVAKLRELNGTAGAVIQLEAGNYELPEEAMIEDANNGIGAISVNKVKLIGLGEKPEDVKLIGNGKIRAVIAYGNAWLENLMITNGNTTAGYTPPGGSRVTNSTRGGGVYGACIITNCVIAGCKASHGGGVASCSNLVKTRLYGNSASYGGAVFGMSFSGCVLENNTADQGGGVWLNGTYTVKDSVFSGNSATGTYGGGGIFQQDRITIATNCVFVENSANVGNGGATCGRAASTTANIELQGCVASNNTAKTGGACYKSTLRGGIVVGNVAEVAGGGLYSSSTYGCRIVNNKSKDGGGCYSCYVYDQCVIAGNISTNGSGGGGLFASWAYDSVISNNFAFGASGGGVYLDDKGTYVISNCLVYANCCTPTTANSYGGGIICKTKDSKIIDSEIVGNYGMTAPNAAKKNGLTGGVHGGTIIGCSIHDNYADSLCGGCREGIAYNCRIYNNDSGDVGKNCHSMQLIGCDIADNTVAYGSAYGCTFHDVVSGLERTLTNNPFKVGHTYTSATVWNYHMNATNCLFRNNAGGMFVGTEAGGVSASLVNCTIADNAIGSLLTAFKDSSHPLEIINCAFVNNTDANGRNPRDINFVATSVFPDGMRMSNCIYGTTSVANLGDFAEDVNTLYKLGAGGVAGSPRFNRNGAYPYEPKRSSPLVGRGKVMSWMTDAYDIRGEADEGKYLRLRDRVADVGCYQCWLDPVGMMLLFK